MKKTVNTRLLQERMLLIENYNNLVKALKQNNAIEAKRALAGLGPRDLRMTTNAFRELANAVLQQDLDKARQIFGVEKEQNTSSDTHNPITGQPWDNKI